MTAPTSPQTKPTRTAPPESALARLGQQLERQGLTPAERLAAFSRLPEPVQAAAWHGLRRSIEDARAEAER